jgi:hypothetical protein
VTGKWYVAFKKGRDTVMHIAGDRAAAIDCACEMLACGVEVTEVGSLAELPGTALRATGIREIFERRKIGAGSPDRLDPEAH